LTITSQRAVSPLVRLGLLILLLYAFFVSISLMGASFKFFGKGFAEQLLATTASPFVGLFIGILSTSVVQSSSTTTSLTVGLVAAGGLDITHAIPIVMGANVGTSVTNTLVSVGHISRPIEFRRAFAAATVHDLFNLISVVIFFPLQLATNFLGHLAGFFAEIFGDIGGYKAVDPLKTAVKPAVELVQRLSGESGAIMLAVSIILLFTALRFIVVNLRALVIGKIKDFINDRLFKRASRAFLLGLVLTIMVQSSSITTSLVVPLAGAGVLTLLQIFPMTLGANVGTTITAMLASLVTGDPAAVTVAFAHLLFNICGIMMIWPFRRVPIFLAETLATWSFRSRVVPFLYILIVFFAIPLLLITLIE
jgi:sodium-dependent phosphate cotransporter